MTTIRFVVDSACDVPAALVKKHQMTVVPAYVNYGGQSYADNDGDFDRAAYYRKLPTIDPLPKTAAMSAGLAEQMMMEAYEAADHLFVVTVASDLSGVHNSMRLGAQALPTGAYTMFDSQTLSMAAGYQAIIGAEVAEKTGDVAAVTEALTLARRRSIVFAAAQTVTYLWRGGRVSWTAGTIGTLLRIKPIVAVAGGEVAPAARVRTKRAWLDTLADLVRERAPLERVTLLHANNEPALDEIRQRLNDVLPSDVQTALVTPSIGTHVGPGAIGVALVSKT